MENKVLISLGFLILLASVTTFILISEDKPSVENQEILSGKTISEQIPISESEPTTSTPEPTTPTPEPTTSTPEPEQQIKKFTIIAKRYEFVPGVITVNQGDKVKLILTTSDVTHGLRIAKYGINERISPGQTTTIEFEADIKGEFPMSCSVSCGSGHSAMRGTLIVI